jgi:type IV pilus assembly protein PilN
MIRINLLPQDELPKQRTINMPSLGAFAPIILILIAVVSLTGVSVYQSQKIADLKAIIAEEEAESRRLAPEIAKIRRLNEQRSDLNERLDVITDLDRDRYFRIHLLDELNRSMPDHMWLTNLEDMGGDLYNLEGITFSNFLVSDFMQNLVNSPYFAHINLLYTEKGTIQDAEVVKFKAQTTAVRVFNSVPFGS